MSTGVWCQGWGAVVGGDGWQRGDWNALSADVVYLLSLAADAMPAGAKVTGQQDGRAWRWQIGERSYVDLGTALEVDPFVVGPCWEGLGPRELLEAFGAFERLCGVPWGDSVGRTAEALILACHPRQRGGRRLDLVPQVPEPARDNHLEMPYMAWKRELTGEEKAAGYVHMFDANAQYLGAWGVTHLGHGRAVHQKAPVFDKSQVGFWRLEGVDALRLPDSLIPAPWLPDRQWYATPTVARLLEVCEGFDAPLPVEAWIWPERSRFLQPAGERLRDARAAAIVEMEAQRAVDISDDDAVDAWCRRRAAAVSVKQAVSLIYQVQTGRFGMAKRDPRSGWARPDWGNLVRAQARTNLHRRLSKLTQAPFAIATDGLLFATDEADPVAFAARIGLPLGDGLGQYKLEGSTFMERVDVSLGVGKLFDQVARAGDG